MTVFSQPSHTDSIMASRDAAWSFARAHHLKWLQSPDFNAEIQLGISDNLMHSV